MLVPIGGGVVDAVASIIPVGAGTCLRAPLFADDEDDDDSRNPFFMINSIFSCNDGRECECERNQIAALKVSAKSDHSRRRQRDQY